MYKETMSPPVDIRLALSPSGARGEIDEIINSIIALNEIKEQNDIVRLQLVEKAKSLLSALETPRETMVRHLWAEPTCSAAIAVGVDMGLFAEMVAQSDSACKAADLATRLGVDSSVLCRVMRHIAALGYLHEVGPDEYSLTNFSQSLSIPIIGDGYPGLCASNQIAINRLPQYLKNTKYVDPIPHGAFKFAHSTDLPIFGWFGQNPAIAKQFGHHMAAYVKGQPTWMDIYPVQEGLLDGFANETNAVMFVDVGGSHGHVVQELHDMLPTLPGRLVVQDLPEVIGDIGHDDLAAKIERVPHDFFTEQPIKGARAYYMRSVLHDWDDIDCGKLLANLRPAMKVGYSKLLINEYVIPAVKANWQATSLDIIMMADQSSRERTASEWEAILTQAGFSICKIWSSPIGGQALIECELSV